MKKGFTLVEMVAVFLIITVIFMLVFWAVTQKSKGLSSDSDKNQDKLIISSAKSYFYKNDELRQQAKNGSEVKISYATLRDNGYFRGDLIDINSNQGINMNTSYVCVNYSVSNYEYTFKLCD